MKSICSVCEKEGEQNFQLRTIEGIISICSKACFFKSVAWNLVEKKPKRKKNEIEDLLEKVE